MQYKNTQKIVIDKRKLDILLRLNCPKENIYEAIVNNKIIYTNDELIDDNLESFVDIKIFDNWGGARNGAGRKSSNNNKKNQDEIQDVNQDEIQDVNQDTIQVVDIDIDIDKDIDKKNNKLINKELGNKFIEFYSNYPKKVSKENAKKKFISILQNKKASFEQLMQGLEKYKNYIVCNKIEKQYIKHPATWLNQGCWEDVYEEKQEINNPYMHNARL